MNEVLLDQVESLQSQVTHLQDSLDKVSRPPLVDGGPALPSAANERRGAMLAVLEDDIRALNRTNMDLLGQISLMKEAHRAEAAALRDSVHAAELRAAEAEFDARRLEERAAHVAQEHARCSKRLAACTKKAQDTAAAATTLQAERSSLVERLDALRERNDTLSKALLKLEGAPAERDRCAALYCVRVHQLPCARGLRVLHLQGAAASEQPVCGAAAQ
jgi:hypothetical protein